MNYLIQRGKVRSQVINVPEGLPELLSDITREVLRCQPTAECLCQFIIDYLHSVIVAREKSRMAKSIIDRALRVVDEIISDMCICDISKEKAEELNEAMEECFKRFLAKRRCETGRDREIIKFNDIDLLDDMIQRCHFNEDEMKTSRPVIEAAYEKFVETYMASQENVESTEALYQYFRERELERILLRKKNKAAIKIQSMFRGFMVRRTLFSERPTQLIEMEDHNAEREQSTLMMDLAARKIQQFFRNRVSLRKYRDESIALAQKVDEICQPGSRISLTPHKVDDTMPVLPDNKYVKEVLNDPNTENEGGITITNEEAQEAAPLMPPELITEIVIGEEHPEEEGEEPLVIVEKPPQE